MSLEISRVIQVLRLLLALLVLPCQGPVQRAPRACMAACYQLSAAPHATSTNKTYIGNKAKLILGLLQLPVFRVFNTQHGSFRWSLPCLFISNWIWQTIHDHLSVCTVSKTLKLQHLCANLQVCQCVYNTQYIKYKKYKAVRITTRNGLEFNPYLFLEAGQIPFRSPCAGKLQRKSVPSVASTNEMRVRPCHCAAETSKGQEIPIALVGRISITEISESPTLVVCPTSFQPFPKRLSSMNVLGFRGAIHRSVERHLGGADI